MNRLRTAFADTNARFHLVGFYTLAHLMRRFVALFEVEDPVVFPLALAALLVFQGTIAGLFGLAFGAVGGTGSEARAFPRHAATLFLPILWLTFKIDLIALGIGLAVAAGVQLATGTPFPQALEQALFWGAPAIGFLTQVLALYSRPLCILARLRGERRPCLREGLALLRARAGLSAQVLGLLLATTVMSGVLHYSAGPQPARAEPGVPEALLLFLDCYFEMVGFFLAARVVLERFAPDGTRPLPADLAPGPPA